MQRTQLIDAFFFGRNVFQVALLLLQAHVAKAKVPLQLWSYTFAEAGERNGLYVHGESAREQRITADVFAILFNIDGTISSDDELRTILKCFEFSGYATQTRLHFFATFEHFRPNLTREAAGCITGARIAKRFPLLRAALTHGGHRYHQPHFLVE